MTNFKRIIESSQQRLGNKLVIVLNNISYFVLIFNCSLLIRKLLGKFQKERLYGVFADVTLVEEEVDCNLTPYTCSRFEPFLTLPAYPSQNHIRRSDDDIYRKQGETNFSFRRTTPTCRRTCFG